MRPKPRVLQDIQPSGADVFRRVRPLVNLSAARHRVSPRRWYALAVLILLAPFLFFGSAAAPVTSGTTLAANSADEAKRQALESELQQLEDQIANYEDTILGYQKQGASLKNEIDSLNAKIAKINLQIKAITISLGELDSEIRATSAKINDTVGNINTSKTSLADMLQNIYESDSQSLAEILLAHPQLSDFFGSVSDLMTLQQNVQVAIAGLTSLEDELRNQKEELGIKRADTAALKQYQDAQRLTLQSTKQEKNTLLTVTKGKESEYQKVLTETKKTAAQIRSQIFELLGGGELTFDKAYSLAQAAERATGVRAALILAVLDRESALGQNVGRCDYSTAMHPTRDVPAFLGIIAELGLQGDLDAGIIKVSCPNADGLYGGAMGPAQFLPSTWNIYKAKVAELTGISPANPWRNPDAFMATALYLRDAGAASNEKQAAARYYCGSSWNRYACLNVYGQRVVEQANRFQEDINVLNAS